MTYYGNLASIRSAFLLLGISASVASSLIMSTSVSAQETQESFPDVSSDYWAQPFIQRLAERGVVTGYLDGTYRPEQSLDRDEFAAMIRQAFNQERVRTIPSGSVFNDVPANYWAAPPIEEAYETGFMRGHQGNLFHPRDEVSRVQALVSLTNGLDLGYKNPTAAMKQSTATPVTIEPANQRQASRKSFMFPMAMTSLMQPLYRVPVKNQKPPVTSSPATVATSQTVPSQPSASELVSSYYTDANQIPDYAIDDVAAATRANMVVNHPDVKLLNPNQSLSRGAAAALIYQALVSQGKMEPLSSNLAAYNYIVNPTSDSNQTAQTTQ